MSARILIVDDEPRYLRLMEANLITEGFQVIKADFYDAFARRNATAPRASLRTAQAYLWIGLISGALGDPAAAAEAYHGAIERFEQLTKEEPGNAEHFRQLAETYRGLADVAPQWEAAKQWSEKSRQAYSRAIELKPDDILAYLGRATILERLDRAKAVTDYEKALRATVAARGGHATLWRPAPGMEGGAVPAFHPEPAPIANP